MKTCSKCGLEKHKSDFHKNRGRSDGVQTWCKPCAISARVDYYKRHRKREAQRNITWAKKGQEKVRSYLESHPCVDCGEQDIVVLEFDHVRGKKEAYVSVLAKQRSWKNVKREIEKCEVRCANCHRRRHARLVK